MFNQKIAFVIQARMGSTRLPGKVLKPFSGIETILSVIVNNLKRSLYYTGENIVLATTVNQLDNELENYSKLLNIKLYRGSEKDVLKRFILASDNDGFKYIVRICSDNPLLDISLMDYLISSLAGDQVDYLSYVINNRPAILSHYGFFTEIVKIESLKKLHAQLADSPEDFEHVTLGLYNRPEQFNCQFVDISSFFHPQDGIRTTVDTIADFNLLKSLYETLFKMNSAANFIDVISFIRNNEVISNGMKQQILINTK